MVLPALHAGLSISSQIAKTEKIPGHKKCKIAKIKNKMYCRLSYFLF